MFNCIFGVVQVIEILVHRLVNLIALHMLPQLFLKPSVSFLKLEQLLLAQMSLLHL